MTALAEMTTRDSAANVSLAEKRAGQLRRLNRLAFRGDPDAKPYRDRFKIAQDIRRPMEPVWREVRDYLLPACGRYLDENYSDPNDEDYRVCYSAILDSSPTKMAITCADGLHGGLTNQAEQWFSLYVGNYNDYEKTFGEEAKAWIEDAQEAERDTLAQSNFYSEVYQLYLEACGFGNALMLVLSDPETYVRYYTKTIGSYWWLQDHKKRIDTVFVRLTYRASDLVAEYGEKNCPDRVMQAIKNKQGDKKFNVIQCIQPWNHFGRDAANASGDENRMSWQYEDVRFLEDGGGDKDGNDRLLFRGGYRTKPFVAVRWSDAGDYTYARTCPGIDALPDIKQLQVMTLDYNMAIKWRVDPAYATTSDEIKEVMPGCVYKVDGNVRDNLLNPVVPPDFDIPAVTQAAQSLRDRISATLYNREILLVQSRPRQITATEVNQLIQEKNAVLGPISARIGDNALIPTLDRTFEVLTEEWHILRDPPEEIQGLHVKPYFTGQLAKAQRQGGVVQQIQQAIQIAGGLAELDQQSLAYWDWGAMLRGADEVDLFIPGTIRTQDSVDQLQAQQQQAMQGQQQMAGLQQAAAIAKDAGAAKMTPETMLGQMAGMRAEGQGDE